MGVTNLLRIALLTALVGMGGAAVAEQLSGTTPSTGSGGHAAMISLANLVGKHTDHSIELNTNVPAPINMVGLGRGENDMGYIAFSFRNHMLNRTGPFKDLETAPEVWGNVRALFGFPAGYFHFITYADSGVQSFDDLKGKTVFAGPPNGSQEALMMLLAKEGAGLEAGTDFDLARLDYAGGEQAFKDQIVSVMIKPAPLGAASVEQFGLTRPFRLLGVPEAAREAEGVKEFFSQPGRMMLGIPPNTYAGQVNEEPALSLAFALGVGVNKDVDESVVYDIMTAMLSNYDEFRKAGGAMFDNLKMEDLLNQVNAPLHPGAVRAYREAGVEVPEALVPSDMN